MCCFPLVRVWKPRKCSLVGFNDPECGDEVSMELTKAMKVSSTYRDLADVCCDVAKQRVAMLLRNIIQDSSISLLINRIMGSSHRDRNLPWDVFGISTSDRHGIEWVPTCQRDHPWRKDRSLCFLTPSSRLFHWISLECRIVDRTGEITFRVRTCDQGRATASLVP